MKKNNNNNTKPTLDGLNPMMDAESLIDLPRIHAQAYDVPLPYCDSTRHMRGVRRKDGLDTKDEIKR